jgi:hypothetical protein
MKASDISPTFCILPWIHLSSRPNGHMRLCCTANASSAGVTNDKEFGGEIGILKEADGIPSNFGHHDITNSWNNQYMKNVRVGMLKGKIPPSCLKCFKEEKAGHNSKRMWETEYWSKRIDLKKLIDDTKEDGTIPEKIYYFDLRFGTKCDLKCIMCSPHDSSMWIGDWAKLYPQIKNESLKELCTWNNKGKYDGASYTWYKNNPKFWEQLYAQIPHMQQLYMAGGEALIIKEYEQLLDKIIEMGYAKKITLRYNSNGMTLSQRLIDKWQHFKHVRFHFSIDSVGDMNTYIRWPSKWDVVKEKLRMIDNTPKNVEITIACAVQALNIYYIPDLINWKLESCFKKVNKYPLGSGLINFHFVYHPAFLNVKVLPQWFKDETKRKYEEFYEHLEDIFIDDYQTIENNPYGIPRLKGMINFMMSGDWSSRLPEFREYINLMDKIRGTDFKKTFPEMRGIL